MGIFDQRTVMEKLVREVGYTDYEYKQELSSFNFSPYIHKIRDEELLSDIVRSFVRKQMDFSIHMDFVTNMFNSICLDRNNKVDKMLFESFLNLYVENPEVFILNNSFDKVFNAFDKKEVAYEFFNFLTKNENILENTSNSNLTKLMDYVSKARQYYLDDRALLSSAITLFRSIDPIILKHGDTAVIEELIEAKLVEDRKANGIYDNIDEAKLAEMDAKLDRILTSGQTLDTLIQTADNTVKVMRKELEKTKTELKEARIREVAELEKRSGKIISDFTASYLELMSQQRSTLVDEKDIIFQQLNTEFEKKKAELLTLADNVGKRVTLELGRVTNVTNDSVQRLREFVENSEEIKGYIQDAKTNDDLMAVLSQVIQASHQVGIPIPISDSDVKIPNGGDIFAPKSSVVMSGVVPGVTVAIPAEPERILDPKVNYYFDETVPFKDRFAELMHKKNQDIAENGTIYHEEFDNVLKFILLGETPYMIGPSGCGKTYMLEQQIANLLGMKVVTDSYITFEQAVIGYTNSGNGAYVPSNFYRCYKYGDIYFLDEIDNGIANATIILNKFMGNSNDSFTFPDGITINRHPNFRIVTAGNTKGSGRTLAYNTRQKLDEATLQRMVPIEIDYDNRIEMGILKGHKAWYDFAVNFRKAIEKVPSDSGEEVNSIGTFTTRDAKSIKKCLDAGAFTDEELMQFQIVQTKDQDYLSRIGEHMREQKANGEFTTNGGAKLLQIFFDVCEKKKGKVRCKTQ